MRRIPRCIKLRTQGATGMNPAWAEPQARDWAHRPPRHETSGCSSARQEATAVSTHSPICISTFCWCNGQWPRYEKLLAAEFAENVEQGLCFSATLASLFANFVVKCLL